MARGKALLHAGGSPSNSSSSPAAQSSSSSPGMVRQLFHGSPKTSRQPGEKPEMVATIMVQQLYDPEHGAALHMAWFVQALVSSSFVPRPTYVHCPMSAYQPLQVMIIPLCLTMQGAAAAG
jgi:hypothetical protein